MVDEKTGPDETCEDLPNLKDPHELGKFGERVAAAFLEDHGFTVLARNYRTPYGEADLVCRHGDETVFVEVKTRLGKEANPEEAVDRRKILRYRNMTLDYLRRHPEVEQMRFDVMAINLVDAKTAHVRHLMGVCSWEG